MKGLLKVFFYLIVPLLGAYAFLVISPQQLSEDVATTTLFTRIWITFWFVAFEITFGSILLRSPTEIYQQALRRSFSPYNPILEKFGSLMAFFAFCMISALVYSSLTDFLPQWQLWHWPLTILWTLLTGAAIFRYQRGYNAAWRDH